MKAITVTQPHATLIAIRAKKIETRSWSTSYRGVLAIHAGAGLGPVGGKRGLYDLCYSPRFLPVLEPAMTGERDIAGFKIPHIDPGYLPLGAIVAICELVDCVPTEHVRSIKIVRRGDHEWLWTEQEKAFGDYAPGRFAWLLANVRPLDTPIKVRGALGLWTWNAPEAIAHPPAAL